jgi:hypothetical protein
MSVQNLAAASQKLTWPGVTGVLPAITVAVRVTVFPCATVVTASPPEVTDSVVVVGAGAAHAGSSLTPWQKKTTAMKQHKGRKRAGISPPRIKVRCKRMDDLSRGTRRMSLYSLTKFAQIYSSHSCRIVRGVRKNLWNPSLEAPNHANALEPSHCCGFVHIAQC